MEKGFFNLLTVLIRLSEIRFLRKMMNNLISDKSDGRLPVID